LGYGNALLHLHNTRANGALCNPHHLARSLSPRVLIVNMSDDEDYYIFKPPLELIRSFCAAAHTLSQKRCANARRANLYIEPRKKRSLLLPSVLL
jgi:hypothetical protein